MARKVKHNWPGLKAEFELGNWGTLKEFAESKGLDYSQVRKAFAKVERIGAPEERAKLAEGKKKKGKNTPEGKKGKPAKVKGKQGAGKSGGKKEGGEDGAASDPKEQKGHTHTHEGAKYTPKEETFINERLGGKTNPEAAQAAGY